MRERERAMDGEMVRERERKEEGWGECERERKREIERWTNGKG